MAFITFKKVPPENNPGSEVIDRAARALFALEWEELDYDMHVSPAGRRRIEGRVRAVLQAIREPSEGMVEAGDETPLGFDASPRDVWRAMIDAALEEGC